MIGGFPETLYLLAPKNRPPLAEYLARYPALDGWVKMAPDGRQVDWPADNMPMTLNWKISANLKFSGHVLDPALTRYRGSVLAFPSLEDRTGNRLPVHPLMAWWMVLYALSMLTRYEPDRWTKMIDVNHSAAATAIEYVLEAGVGAIPDVVDEALEVLGTG